MSPRQYKHFPIKGGEDLVTPPVDKSPSSLIFSKNYELDPEGRPRRIKGYQAFDGSDPVEEALIDRVNFDAGVAVINVGDTVTETGGSKTGYAVAVVVESGDWATSDAVGYLILTNLSGAFAFDDVPLQVGAVTKATQNGAPQTRIQDGDDDNYDTWYQAAIEHARSNITAPGSYQPVGLTIYSNNAYAFARIAGTSTGVYKSGTTWTAVDLGDRLAFTSGGTYEIAEADTITGATSTETATVERVVVTSGTWAGGDAAGFLYISSQSGAFQAENLDVGASSNVATIAGDSVDTILPEITGTGRSSLMEFATHNFYGTEVRLYGTCEDIPLFEFDGTRMVILDPPATGTTNHIAIFKEHLFLLHSTGELLHSATGDPNDWTAAGGAATIPLTDVGTGLLTLPGGTMAIFCRTSTHILYGNDNTDWELKEWSPTVGAVAESIQPMLGGVYATDEGWTTLRAVQEFGDFGSNVLSKIIEPLVSYHKGNLSSGDWISASTQIKDNEQYVVFFNFGEGLIFTFNSGKFVGITRIDYGTFPVHIRLTASGTISGEEVTLFCLSADEYVYRMNIGNSLNGSALASSAVLAYNHTGSPDSNKGFIKAVLEVMASPDTTFTITPKYDYGHGVSQTAITASVNSGSGEWDGETDAATITEFLELYLGAPGRNVSLDIASTGTYDDPHTIQGVTLHYSPRGVKR
jgi:hypothetical protein